MRKMSEPSLTNLDVLAERGIITHRASALIEELKACHKDSRALVKGSASKPAGHGHVDLLMASLARIEHQRSWLIGQLCNRLVRAIDSQEKCHPAEGIATVHPQMEHMISLDTPKLHARADQCALVFAMEFQDHPNNLSSLQTIIRSSYVAIEKYSNQSDMAAMTLRLNF
jgi:hypothetical protein